MDEDIAISLGFGGRKHEYKEGTLEYYMHQAHKCEHDCYLER